MCCLWNIHFLGGKERKHSLAIPSANWVRFYCYMSALGHRPQGTWDGDNSLDLHHQHLLLYHYLPFATTPSSSVASSSSLTRGRPSMTAGRTNTTQPPVIADPYLSVCVSDSVGLYVCLSLCLCVSLSFDPFFYVCFHVLWSLGLCFCLMFCLSSVSPFLLLLVCLPL
jgi:hypothetical protein